jgi:hypothetical protein
MLFDKAAEIFDAALASPCGIVCTEKSLLFTE